MEMNELLQITIDRKASDIHFVPGYFPNIRINNELYALKNQEILNDENLKKLLLPTLSEEQKENLLANKEIDYGYDFNGNRFRINLYYVRGTIAASLRLVPSIIKTLPDLSLPPILEEFIKYKQGLVLLTGPTGEGKSTTLAAMINQINQTTAKHIITIEDPIEFVYPVGKSIVSQRELHQDTHSFNIALRSILREDPDVVLVGEMRDYETIQATLTIAETGHLVFSTLHTKSSPESIDRIIDIFPSDQQNQVRKQLSSLLISIVSQRLIPNADKTGRVPATEILLNNSAVASIIREGKNFLIDNVLETGEASGMMIFEKCLYNMYQKGMITKETAYDYAIRPHEIKKFLK